MDCDFSTDLKAIDESLENIKNSYDVVIGSRFLKESILPIKRTLKRRFISKCCNKIVNAIFHFKLKDTQCGFKTFRFGLAKDIAKFQKINDWSFDVEYLYISKLKNKSIKEIPVTWTENDNSTVKVFKASKTFIKSLFKIKKYYSNYGEAPNRKKIKSKISYFIGAGCLIALFLSLLSIFTFKNNYSDEYKLYYITKELKYYVPDDGIKENYKINTVCKYTKDGNYKNIGKEWNNIEDDGISTTNEHSNFFYYVSDFINDKFLINIKTTNLYTCEKSIYINGINTYSKIKFNNSNFGTTEISSAFLNSNKINKFSLYDNNNLFKVNQIEVKWL